MRKKKTQPLFPPSPVEKEQKEQGIVCIYLLRYYFLVVIISVALRLPPYGRGRGERPSLLLHMHIRLWEWNLDIILVEGVVDALENLAVITVAGVNAYPDDNLEDEGRVA